MSRHYLLVAALAAALMPIDSYGDSRSAKAERQVEVRLALPDGVDPAEIPWEHAKASADMLWYSGADFPTSSIGVVTTFRGGDAIVLSIPQRWEEKHEGWRLHVQLRRSREFPYDGELRCPLPQEKDMAATDWKPPVLAVERRFWTTHTIKLVNRTTQKPAAGVTAVEVVSGRHGSGASTLGKTDENGEIGVSFWADQKKSYLFRDGDVEFPYVELKPDEAEGRPEVLVVQSVAYALKGRVVLVDSAGQPIDEEVPGELVFLARADAPSTGDDMLPGLPAGMASRSRRHGTLRRNEFGVKQIPPGEYRIQLMGRREHMIVGPKTIVIPEDGSVTDVEVKIGKRHTKTLHVRVRPKGGQNSLPNAKVTVSGGGLSRPVHRYADSDGEVAIEDLVEGEYRVRASAAGFARTTEPVDLTQTGEVAIELHRQVTASIQVVNEQGRPAQDMHVVVVQPELQGPWESAGTTDAAGTVALSRLVEGRAYAIVQSGKGRGAAILACSAFDVAPGQTYSLSLSEPVEWKGNIQTKAGGNRGGRRQILVMHAEHPIPLARGGTAADGSFSLSVLPGQYRLFVAGPAGQYYPAGLVKVSREADAAAIVLDLNRVEPVSQRELFGVK